MELSQVLGMLVFFGGFIGVIMAANWVSRKSKLGGQVEADPPALARMEERIAELEERVDFSERLLTEMRARQPLPGPGKERGP